MGPKIDKRESQLAQLWDELEYLARDIEETRDIGSRCYENPQLANLFKARLSLLGNSFDKFQGCFKNAKSLAMDLGEESTRFDELRYKTKNHFYEALSFDASGETSVAKEPINDINSVVQSHIKLPTINLPTFDGQISKWMSFKDTYLSLIHNNPQLSNIQKFHYLHSTLKGSALQSIAAILTTSDGYQQAWDTLVHKYDNKRIHATNYLINIFNFKPITKFDYQSLEYFSEIILESATAFRNMNLKDPSGFILLTYCLKLLDTKSRERFEYEFSSSSEIPSFDDFSSFIQRQCFQLQADALTSNIGAHTQYSQPHRSQPVGKRVMMATDSYSNNNTCPLCRERHRLYKCPNFLSMEPRERFNKLRALNLCSNCLKTGHYASTCPCTSLCHHCNRRHHSLVHFPTSTSSPRSPDKMGKNASGSSCFLSNTRPDLRSASDSVSAEKTNTPTTSQLKGSVLSSAAGANARIMLGTAIGRIEDSCGRYLPIRILIDCGSQRSFISSKYAQKLGLARCTNPHTLCGFGDRPIEGCNYQTSCTLVPTGCLYPRLTTNAVIVPKIIESVPSCPIPRDVIDYFKQYDLADNSFGEPGAIDFLLGADLFGQILTGGCIYREGYPNALQTVFGYVIIGPLGSQSIARNKSVSLITSLNEPHDTLKNTIEKFWEIEKVPETAHIDPENTIVDEYFRSSHSRDPNGRYIVRLPFKDEVLPDLSSSYKTAMNRFLKLEHRLNKIPLLKEKYSNIINEYLDLGYVSLADGPGKYYLPHHCVMKDNTQSKLRIVFDASSSTEFGSLNDHLRVGPKLQLDIRHVLLNFRHYPFVFASDICQMFLQILINKEDVPYLRFLYRTDTSKPVEEYQWNRLPFGCASSPYLAIRVLHQLVIDEGASFPKASETLKNNIYVDDILTGSSTIEEARQIQSELIELLKKGGFSLKKWVSNTPDLLNSLADKQETIKFTEPDNKSVKLLGMQWDSVHDCLSYDIQDIKLIMTKRGIMSAVARMYDPLGYLAPVTFKAKSYLQKLWSLKNLSWDSPLPLAIARDYKDFFESLKLLRCIRIFRCIFPRKPLHVTLVGFADASELGYAAAIYLRVEFPDRYRETHLIMSKTRLAPLKTLSIPKLELCAALMLAQTKLSISSIVDQYVDSTYLFSDSSIVLSWLRLSPHLLKTFVANRVTQILEISSEKDWYHISSSHNPADLASRGSSPNDLINNQLWWNGPGWLTRDFSEWPNILFNEPVTVPEIKPNALVCSIEESNSYFIEVIERVSSFEKLTRIFSYIGRFVRNLKIPITERKLGPLSLAELGEGTRLLIRCVQQHYLPKDSETAMRRIQSLSPFLDNLGILRVGGRLKNSPLPYNAKHPIILPQKAHLTKLLIDHYHRTYLHPGPQLLHSLLLRNYWIISARRIIRHRVHKCTTCYRFRSKTFAPPMSDLPPSRFAQGRPFVITGVDFAGPFMTKESNRRKSKIHKSYVCLFVCLSTRAVHLELVSQLTTEAFLACLDRFVSRRGLPSKILSDNGTNFVGAARHLRDLYLWLNQEETQIQIKSHLNPLQIEWNFIPPGAPHFGGIWEAGVKSFKHHLCRVVKDHILTFEEMNTLVIRIEAVLNSRPLYPLSASPENHDVLTPGHFIIGSPLVAAPEPDCVDTPSNRLSRWQLLQKFTQDIWKRWRGDYLNSLQQKVKWSNQIDNIKPNALVLIRESNVAPLQWPRGRVVEVLPGRDGTVRVVKIRTAKGELIRPVTKLAPLLSPD